MSRHCLFAPEFLATGGPDSVRHPSGGIWLFAALNQEQHYGMKMGEDTTESEVQHA